MNKINILITLFIIAVIFLAVAVPKYKTHVAQENRKIGFNY